MSGLLFIKKHHVVGMIFVLHKVTTRRIYVVLKASA